MQNKRISTLRGLSNQTFVTLCLGVIEILFFSIHSRLLNQSDFGYYAILTAVCTIFYGISEAGLGASIIHKQNFGNSFYNTVFTLSFILGIASSLLLFFLSPLIACSIADDTLIIPMRIMSLTLFLQCMNSFTKANYIKKLSFVDYGKRNVISYLISYSLGCILAIKGYGFYTLVFSVLVYNILLFILSYISLDVKPRIKLNVSYIREIVNYSGWLTLGVILRIVYQQIDKILTPKLLSVSVLGMYNRPAGFVSKFSAQLNHIFDTTLFPILSKKQSSDIQIKTAYSKILYSINFMSSVMSVLFYSGSELIFNIFLGSTWIEVLPIFKILSLTFIVSLNNTVMDCFMRSLALVKAGFYLRILACVLTFSSVVIGSKFGLLGIALGILLSNVLISLSKALYIIKQLQVGYINSITLTMKSFTISIVPFIVSVILIEFMGVSGIYSIFVCTLNIALIVLVITKFKNLLGKEYDIYMRPTLIQILSKLSSKIEKYV